MSYEQVLEITKFLRKIGRRFDLNFNLEKLTDWVEEFLECDLRDLKATESDLMSNPKERPTPAIILRYTATSKARRLSYEETRKRNLEFEAIEREKEEKNIFIPREEKDHSFEKRLREGMSKIFHSHRQGQRKNLLDNFLEEMRRDFPHHAQHPELISMEKEFS